jgi:hypothetical protein
MSQTRLSVFGWPAVALSAVLVTACVPMRVNSYAEPHANVTAYRTYDWAGGDLASTGDPRLDSNRFFVERVQQAADRQLRLRGYQRIGASTPDLILHLHARVEERIDTSELDGTIGPCQKDDCRAHVFDEGTLLIDFVDARTDALVWRGWAERSLDGVVDDQAWMNQVIDKAVTAIFGRLPARSL